jgi:hypothetical protein
MFEVIVTEVNQAADGTRSGTVERYRQCVDAIDLRAVMAAVNKRPRKSRSRSTQPGGDSPTTTGGNKK